MKEIDFNDYLRGITENDEPCLVLRSKEGEVLFYGSQEELVKDWLSRNSMMGICEPLYNVQTDELSEMLKWKAEGPPLGRPLSRKRQLARLALNRGLGYNATLLVMKLLLTTEIEGPRQKNGAPRRQHLTPARARRAKAAVDREWEQQKGEIPPRAPRGWWKA